MSTETSPYVSDEQFIESCVLATMAAESPAMVEKMTRPSFFRRIGLWFRRIFGGLKP